MHFLLRAKLIQKLVALLDRMTWRLLAVMLFVHFFLSWALMVYAESPTSELVKPGVYWWFYIVTGTTVGYGDFSPTTLGGRAVAAFVMIFGIAFFSAIIGKVATAASDYADKRRRGLMSVALENHIVVVGDGTKRTISLVDNLLADSRVKGRVVLVSTLPENPFPGRLAGFVKGEIDSPEVRDRASIGEATTIIVLAETDVNAVGSVISILNHVREGAEIVAFFQNEDAAENLNKQTGDNVRVVVSTDMACVVQEALDPGAADFVGRLLDNREDATYLRLPVPKEVQMTYAEVDRFLLSQGVNVISIYSPDGVVEMIPNPEEGVGGRTLAVIAHSRDQLNSIKW